MVKNLPDDAGDTGDMGSIPGSRRSPGVGNGNPLQYSCLENSMDRGAWWATVHGFTKSGTGLKDEAGKHAVLRHVLSICFVRRAYTGATCWTTGVKFANQPVCRWGSLLAWRWLACPTATCLVSREPHMTRDTLGLSETSLEPGVLNLSNIDIGGLDHPLLWGPPCVV